MVKQIHILQNKVGAFQVSWFEKDLSEWQGWHPANSDDDNNQFEFENYMDMINFLVEIGGHNEVIA
jgi:hypothetical protein